MSRWEDVAAAGFRADQVDVGHFKLMLHPDTLTAIEAELGSALGAHARFEQEKNWIRIFGETERVQQSDSCNE